MTFDPNVPNGGQSPGLFPPQNNTNFARIKTTFNADHVFNDTAQATDGVHRQVTLIARADPSSLPAGTNGIFYNNTFGSTAKPFYYDGARIFMCPLTVASVAWNAAGTIQDTPFNVTSVVNASGIYTVTFPIHVDVQSKIALTCIEPSGSLVVPKILFFDGNTMQIRFMNVSNQTIMNITIATLILFQ